MYFWDGSCPWGAFALFVAAHPSVTNTPKCSSWLAGILLIEWIILGRKLLISPQKNWESLFWSVLLHAGSQVPTVLPVVEERGCWAHHETSLGSCNPLWVPSGHLQVKQVSSMPLFPRILESSAQSWHPKNPVFKGKSKQAVFREELGRGRQGTGKGADHMIWNFGNRQTNKGTKTLLTYEWVPPLSLFSQHFQEVSTQSGDQEVAICYLTAGVDTVLTFELLRAWQAIWLSYRSSPPLQADSFASWSILVLVSH